MQAFPFIRCGRLDPLPSQSRRTHTRRAGHFSEEVRFYELAKLSRVPLMRTQSFILCDLKSLGKARCQQPGVLDGNVNKAHTPAVEPPDAEPSEARPTLLACLKDLISDGTASVGWFCQAGSAAPSDLKQMDEAGVRVQ